MKFTYITGALLAALATAQPVTEEGTPEAVSPIAARTLQKRDDYRIAVWDNDSALLLLTPASYMSRQTRTNAFQQTAAVARNNILGPPTTTRPTSMAQRRV